MLSPFTKSIGGQYAAHEDSKAFAAVVTYALMLVKKVSENINPDSHASM